MSKFPVSGLVKSVCSLVSALAVLEPGCHAQTAPPPNILLITADDLGIQLGCYGDSHARTPNIDGLARRGTRFETAWITQASCSPSRASLLTGTFPHQNGQVGLSHRGFNTKPGIALLPNVLRQAGYFTGVIGKLHVGPEENFDLDFRRSDRVDKINLTQKISLGAEAAAEFFAAAGDKPFFLKYSFADPHLPFRHQVDGSPVKPQKAGDIPLLPWIHRQAEDSGDDEEAEPGKSKPVTERAMAGYYNGVSRLDEGLGLLLEKLKASGKLDNTLIFFLGDNGAPFPGGKTTCYEAGVRVPLLVSWPAGKLVDGSVIPRLTSSVDIYPTALDAAGLPPQPRLPGTSLLPLLRGQTGGPNQPIFAEFNFHSHRSYRPARTVRDEHFQLIHNLTGSPEWELYDLTSDPNQKSNLAGNEQFSADLTRLRQALDIWRRQTNDPLLDPAVISLWREAVAASQKKSKVDPPLVLVR